METVKDMFKTVSELGLQKASMPEFAEYEEYFTEQNKEAIESMWDAEPTSSYISKLKLDDVLKLPFDLAHKYIDNFSMSKRISMLNELSTYRMHLYDQASRYGEGLTKDEQIGPKDFRMLMGKIKHLEIVQNWLYGIQ